MAPLTLHLLSQQTVQKIAFTTMSEGSVRLVIPTERFWPEYTGWVKQTLKLARTAGEQLQFLSVSRPATASAASETSEREVPPNVEIRRRGPSLEQDTLLAKVAYVLSAASFVGRNRQEFNVLYLPYVFFPGFVFILLGTLLGLPVTIRISGQELAPNRSLPARLRFWSLQFVDAVAVLNETDRRRAQRLGVAEERIWFIPNGVDVQQFSPSTHTAPADESEVGEAPDNQGETVLMDGEKSLEEDSRVVIGFAGIVCRRKGVSELLDAYERICTRDNISQPVLRLAGPLDGVEEVDPSFVNEVASRAHAYGGDIQLLGKIENMAYFYRSLDLFVLPSYREGMPNVLLEAMASGLPCVATDIPGVQEVIAPQKNGMLVPPKDVDRLATALSELMRDETLRHSLGHAARETIVESFSLHAMAGRYTDLFVCLAREEVTGNPDTL